MKLLGRGRRRKEREKIKRQQPHYTNVKILATTATLMAIQRRNARGFI